MKLADADALYVGSQDVTAALLGNDEAWSGSAFALDSLAGTPSAPLATPWSKHPSYTGTVIRNTAGTRARMSATGSAVYLRDEIPPAADYSVEIDVTSLTVASINITAGIVLRYSGTVDTGYVLEHVAAVSGTLRRWRLRKVTTGTAVDLGTYDETFQGATRQAICAAIGNTLTVTIDGVQRIAFTDPSPILTAGRIGLKLSNSNTVSDSNGSQLSNFAARA